jgi:hypothetical protein
MFRTKFALLAPVVLLLLSLKADGKRKGLYLKALARRYLT